MKNYLKITNQGLIVPEDLMLIGSSTKRDQKGKIGMFGSGWKYALSYLMRNECTPIIFSGLDQILVDTNVTLHRDTPVNVITVNGRETSLTTQMGPKWSAWMALREIYSNAIDEGNQTISSVFNPEFNGIDNDTCIYIPINNELQEVLLKFDNYFSFNRTPIWSDEVGNKIFLKSEETKLNIYRRGIRCYDSYKDSKLDFDLFDVSINEDRLAQYYHIDSKISSIVSNLPTDIFLLVLKEEQLGYLSSGEMNENTLNNIKSLISQGYEFTTESIKRAGGLFAASKESLTIPVSWYKKLQELGLVKSLFELLAGSDEDFINTGTKDTSGIKYHLKQFNLNIEIKSGKCDSTVFVNDDIAYIKDDCINSDKELAAFIIQKLSLSKLTSAML